MCAIRRTKNVSRRLVTPSRLFGIRLALSIHWLGIFVVASTTALSTTPLILGFPVPRFAIGPWHLNLKVGRRSIKYFKTYTSVYRPILCTLTPLRITKR
ncbi:hypothetical protein JAAARDRAFT_34632 [Jaapia argillacea MUCL 33604]|uniref:Uncharacterized protein n=1 Tax=Jaapia argillacea MUCL 33604 TaxID=933084 RepID=A0A067Q5K1_9AGAM|nr:hypothetical protein JAAARDRAFT_34632 [Jaapia argillacea MUCL 33604]